MGGIVASPLVSVLGSVVGAVAKSALAPSAPSAPSPPPPPAPVAAPEVPEAPKVTAPEPVLDTEAAALRARRRRAGAGQETTLGLTSSDVSSKTLLGG